MRRQPATSRRAALCERVVHYLFRLATASSRLGPLYACDMHASNFGEDRAGNVKLLDVDALYTRQQLRDAASTAGHTCTDNWECNVRCAVGACSSIRIRDVLDVRECRSSRLVLGAVSAADVWIRPRVLVSTCTISAFSCLIRSRMTATKRWA